MKPHPKGCPRETWKCETFERNRSQVPFWNVSIDDLQQFDCLIFDFAGTAFMDAIMTDRGVILIDTGLRKFPNRDVHC